MEEMMWMVDYGSGASNNTTLLDPGNNSNLSCAARRIQGPVNLDFSDTLAAVIRVYQSILLFLAGFSGLILNVLLIILVAKYKKLQILEFGIAVQMGALSIVGAFILFAGLANCVAGRWLYGEHICGVTGALCLSIALVRTLLLLIFVVDRFLSVFLPFKYPKHQKVVVTVLSLAAWSVLPVTATAMNVLDCVEFSPSLWLCSVKFTCSGRCKVLANVLYSFFIPAFIIPVLLYTVLFIKARRAKKAVAIPLSSNEKQAYNWKATITFFLLFMTSFLFTLPAFLTEFFNQIVYREELLSPVPFTLSMISKSLAILVPTTDAVVILRNPDVTQTIKDFKKRLGRRLSLKPTAAFLCTTFSPSISPTKAVYVWTHPATIGISNSFVASFKNRKQPQEV